MNDSILFLALATIFGAAMLVVGWTLRDYRAEREINTILVNWRKALDRDNPNPVDSAGA